MFRNIKKIIFIIKKAKSILIEYAHYDQRFVVFCDSNIAFKLNKKNVFIVQISFHLAELSPIDIILL